MNSHRHHKRRKIEAESRDSIDVEEITSVESLRAALLFRQQDTVTNKHGIRRFKDFLNATLKAKDSPKESQNLQILKAYCDGAAQRKSGKSNCLAELLQTWSLAVETGTESLLSSIPAAIAVFLKTISSHIDFREHGMNVCNALLERDRLRLLERGLTASTGKDFLISPCLRLMTEIVGFDGGTAAALLFSRRDVTYARLDQFLEQRRKVFSGEQVSSPPPLRTFAQRYFIANLTFQDFHAKNALISQPKLAKTLLYGLKHDDSSIVADTLQAIEKNLLSDKEIARWAKRQFFTDQNLTSLATLYSFKPASNIDTRATLIPHRVHAILRTVCTSHEKGLLQPQTGWFPPMKEVSASDQEWKGALELGVDIPGYNHKFEDKVPVKNPLLSRFIENLRPESDILQGDLLVAVFEAAPELVADYFIKNPRFKSEPSLASVWLSHSVFLYKCIELPIPTLFGGSEELSIAPPPENIVLDNVLPRPLSREVLTRCLNITHDEIKIFAARALILAFRKLRDIVSIFDNKGSSTWEDAASHLLSNFSHRVPSMKDVIAFFHRNTRGGKHLRGPALALLASYYDLLPDVAIEENFDGATALRDFLKQVSAHDLVEDESNLEELHSLLQIALCAPSMNWWHKPGDAELSIFSSVLSLATATASAGKYFDQLHKVVEEVAQNYHIVSTDLVEIKALLGSLMITQKQTPGDQTLVFLDNCIVRLAKSLVLYQDLAASMFGDRSMDYPVALFAAVVIEQWTYISSREDSEALQNVALWISMFFGCLSKNRKPDNILDNFQNIVCRESGSNESGLILKKAFENSSEVLQTETLKSFDQRQKLEPQSRESDQKGTFQPSQEQQWKLRLELQQCRKPRKRWEVNDIELSMSEGHLHEMMLCVAHPEEEIRMRALHDVYELGQKMMLIQDTPEGKKKWYMILFVPNGLLESTKNLPLGQVIAPVLAELAGKCLSVLQDPLHYLFPKVCTFLLKGPSWDARKTLRHWMRVVLDKESQEPDSALREINWILDLLVRGLQRPEDVELYQRSGVFERILSLWIMPTLTRPMKLQILELVFRLIELDSSQATIMKLGIRSWLDSPTPIEDADIHSMTAKLIENIEKRRDQHRAQEWEISGKLP
ncbi:MAG: hypothetical protein Q9227_002739 [Pyrenula ochraceoflavens]